MLAAVAELSTQMLVGPEAEVSGPETMYIPTTQLRLSPTGPWHRKSAIATETACGVSYNAAYSREYELDGELCEHCFTSRERFLAAHPSLLVPERTVR